jgi:hypothetical protein
MCAGPARILEATIAFVIIADVRVRVAIQCDGTIFADIAWRVYGFRIPNKSRDMQRQTNS